MTSPIYLDYAAATPIDPAVLAAMQPYFSERFYNPSATYLAAAHVRKEIEAARARIARCFGVRPAEVVFTAGGTEANNLAICGVMEQFPEGNVVISAIEHESVRVTARRYECREAPVTADGIIAPDRLIALVDDNTVLVSVMYANNEVGTVQPIRMLGQKIAEIRQVRIQKGSKRPLYFHADAAQAAAYLDLHTARLGVDMLTINGGKIYGPKQSGALFVSARVPLAPQIWGGGQERGFRSGTENVAGVMGLSTALDIVQQRRHAESERLIRLQQLFFELLKEAVPPSIINGSKKHRLPNNVHLTIPGADNERLIFQLDQSGVLCAAGSACSASHEEPSHVLRAMGIADTDAQSSLRFTMGIATTEKDIRVTVKRLGECLV
ncbi:MAG TPA: cysteine desulfurase family protein [Candidatus Saccharimonadales bacterium]|nr:cysteine desulfurase family protein [Candidatus Saccharimonadales bacterium]